MPISVTTPSTGPLIAPERNWIASPTLNGWASSNTIPANMLDSACCAAIPMNTLVSALAVISCPTGTPNSTSVTTRVVNPPTSSSAYQTTAACAVPILGLSTERALPDSPMVAMIPNTRNATVQLAATTCHAP